MAGTNLLTGAPSMSAQSPTDTAMKMQIGALTYLHNQFATLAAKPDLNFDDVANVAANLVRNNVAPASEIAAQLSKVPRERGKMRAWAMLKQADAAVRAQQLMQPKMGV